jgi:carbonic anhydrase/acetyltransferase-like protein (isoleucine patch superfamily)
VPANSVVVGNPARVVRTLKPTEGEESQAKRKDDATIESLVKRVEFLEEEIRAIKNTLKRQETNSEC